MSLKKIYSLNQRQTKGFEIKYTNVKDTYAKHYESKMKLKRAFLIQQLSKTSSSSAISSSEKLWMCKRWKLTLITLQMHVSEMDLNCNRQLYFSGCISVLEMRTPQKYLHSNFSLQKTKIKKKTFNKHWCEAHGINRKLL